MPRGGNPTEGTDRRRCWSISFPAFPGVVTTGDSFADLMANARDAIASVVAAMEEDGEPIPEGFIGDPGSALYDQTGYQSPHVVLVPANVSGRSVRINVTMDEALVGRLDRLADRARASLSALLARGARMVLAAGLAE
jgi:predicted RNase H-like HicB family nuclease